MRDISNGGHSPSSQLEQDVESLSERLRALGRLRPLRDPVSNAIEEHDITPAQLHALLWLGTDGPLTMGELTRLVGFDKTITGVIDRLEREGHVARQRDESDRRVVRVALTRKGQGLQKKLSAAVREKMTAIVASMSQQDRCDLFRIIDNFLKRLSSKGCVTHQERT